MPQLTLLIEEKCGISSNQIYEAAATYLRSKIGDSSNLNSLRVSKTSRQQGLTADIVIGQSVMDSFQDINWLKCKLCEKKKKTRMAMFFCNILSFHLKRNSKRLCQTLIYLI